MDVAFYVVANIIVYVPFHLFEEAVGDFPKWMYEHKWLPHHMTHGHWMANNLFVYYPFLLASTLLFLLNRQKFLCFGIAVLLWGIINFGEHAFYTIRDLKKSPGLFTGALFLINSVCGLLQSFRLYDLTVPTMVLSLLIGGILFGAPILCNILVYGFFERYIKNGALD